MSPEPSIWTPATITAIGGVVVLILGALTTMIVTLAGLRKKADETALKVDGHLSAMTTELTVARTKIEGLEKIVTSNAADKKVADDLAARGGR